MKEAETKIPDFLRNDKLPWMKWVMYKGEDVVACVNYTKSIACNRPIVDISYCMTKALNCNVMFSVNWKEEDFKKSKLE